MIKWLLVAILIFESVRLVLYVIDSQRARKINKSIQEYQSHILEFSKTMDADWTRLRALEIEELKHLAKESDTMKEIYDEWVANKVGAKENK